MHDNVTALFGLPGAENIEVRVFERTSLSLPVDPQYVFRKDELKLILAYLCTETDGDGLYLHGPFGAGKTSLAKQVLARLNWPTLMTSWKKSSEIDDLVGRTGAKYGDTIFELGPLALAMKHGYALIINEIDRGMADNLIGLNDILDGGYLLIKETGEIIERHPDFRLIVTGNSGGMGDASGQYIGSVRKLDPAFLDRFVFLHIDYMDAANEIDLLLRAFPTYTGEFVSRMVNFASETRLKAADITEILSLAISTRALRRFFRLGMSFGLDNYRYDDVPADKLMRALRPSYLDRLQPEEQTAAMVIFTMTTGIPTDAEQAA